MCAAGTWCWSTISSSPAAPSPTPRTCLRRAAPSACSPACCWKSPASARCRSMRISSASIAPICSWSATGWTWRTSIGNCRSSASSRRRARSDARKSGHRFSGRHRDQEEIMARILIAEDEEALRALTARALTDAGHEVVTAVDGADALDVLTREQGRFELLLTDIKMPLMDGIALALATARDYPAIIILLMTAYADQRERAANLDALIHDVILKPFTLAEIKAAVNEALGASKPAP